MKAQHWWIPAVLGVLAAGANYMALTSSAEPLQVIVVREAVEAGQKLTPDKLGVARIQCSPDLLRSLVPQADIGKVVDRQVTRMLTSGELLLFTDIRSEADDYSLRLRKGETSITVPARASQIAPGLRPGDEVMFLIGPAEGVLALGNTKVESLIQSGPFRLVGIEVERSADAHGPNQGQQRKVIVASPPLASQKAESRLDALLSARESNGRMVMRSVEYHRPETSEKK